RGRARAPRRDADRGRLRPGREPAPVRGGARVILRPGGSQDVPFLRDMLRHAYYWRADEAFEDEEPLSRYVNGWGRPGDAALVALEGPNPVGAAWYRLFTHEHPGFGYIDDSTPELAIAVVPSRRGK